MPFDRPGNLPPVHLPRLGPKLDFDDYVPFALTAISNKLARGASRIYLDLFGVGINEWRVLAYLRVAPETTANAICQHSSLDKAAVSRSLRLLEQSEHVEAKRDPEDARGRQLRLTPAGMALHDRIILIALDREARLLAGFTPTEKRQLLDFMGRMRVNIAVMDGSDDAPETSAER